MGRIKFFIYNRPVLSPASLPASGPSTGIEHVKVNNSNSIDTLNCYCPLMFGILCGYRYSTVRVLSDVGTPVA
jgi:hypothetical protein